MTQLLDHSYFNGFNSDLVLLMMTIILMLLVNLCSLLWWCCWWRWGCTAEYQLRGQWWKWGLNFTAAVFTSSTPFPSYWSVMELMEFILTWWRVYIRIVLCCQTTISYQLIHNGMLILKKWHLLLLGKFLSDPGLIIVTNWLTNSLTTLWNWRIGHCWLRYL